MICIARHSKSLKGRKERKNDEPIRSRENKKIIWGIRNRIFNSLTPGFSPCKKKKKEKKKICSFQVPLFSPSTYCTD